MQLEEQAGRRKGVGEGGLTAKTHRDQESEKPWAPAGL